ncbi:DNA helicase-2/ATP-dependent DNA helicase PcrA [Clavibacter sp. B3I6]|uniref:ATP-dependent helicase n=1 Tax=Clavibacter sp. B3I6 TaxID=3042268 RepID=UPI00278B295E|nr:ATP-dependent helicase [Clavibacter sp. B3I6]MDQ0743601.1 DNA helicase-2/ATP-dependent DNA helicase PcrA [Clavibacter sp. B3I6]
MTDQLVPGTPGPDPYGSRAPGGSAAGSVPGTAGLAPLVPVEATEEGPTAETLLEALDDQQRLAAQALLGPVVVLAGAGTGKTRAITHRIAYGIQAGVYPPNRVMALTFTSRAAAELRGRLRELGAGPVAARTFHAAALKQLNFFWPQVVGGTMPRLIESKGRMLGHAAESLRLRLDTAALRDMAAEVEWRKVSMISIEQYGLAARTTRTLPPKLDPDQAVALLQAYEDIKDQRRQLDFEDVLLATAGMIEAEPWVAQQVREQYRFFVVDEYQDVSPLQQTILDLWMGDRRDLCVVGDASQTIYSFAGAKSAYLLDFASRFPEATVVRLERNYRSTSGITEAANRLMRGRPGALTLVSADADPDGDGTGAVRSGRGSAAVPGRGEGFRAPQVSAFPSDGAEARAIAGAVAQQIASGIAPEDIAVLYRMNGQSAVLEQALGDAGVSYQVRGSQRFFDRPEIKQALLALRGASVSISGEPLFKSVSDVLRGLGWSQQPPEQPGAVRDRWESLDAIMGLAERMPAGSTFRAFTDELLERQAGQHEPTVSAVTLATLHSAKGLEWEHVYLMGLSEGLVPISYAQTLEAVDEERRLLYVGITRARSGLRLSWSRSGPQRSGQREPSRFLAELDTRIAGGGATRGA